MQNSEGKPKEEWGKKTHFDGKEKQQEKRET